MAPQPRVFFDFTIDDEPLGRVVFELFSHVVPKTAENFRALCTGSLGISPFSSIPLHYKSSEVHRVVEGFMIQGGDFTKRTGAGGESIYGGMFEDERLEGPGTEVDKPGLLVMANRGPDSNGSQWFITLAPAPHLTGKHVVFGRVVGGFEHVQKIGRLPVGDKSRPLSQVTISHCGELELRKPVTKKISLPRSVSPPRKTKRDGSVEKEKPKREKERRKKKREETEDELDARLEREEKERLEVARLEKLAAMKRDLENERQRVKDGGGVVYKGRGAMRYLDPEASARAVPKYAPRAPDTRPNPRRAPPQTAAAREKWQRGPDVGRPSFDKSASDRDLDRYGTRRQKEGGGAGGREGGEDKGRGRDFDDWRAGRISRSRSPRRERRRSPSGERHGDRRSVSLPREPRAGQGEKRPGERQRSPSPAMRPESPLRGDRSDGSGSDMVIEEDD